LTAMALVSAVNGLAPTLDDEAGALRTGGRATPSPRSMRGEGWGEAQQSAPTFQRPTTHLMSGSGRNGARGKVSLVAAPHPDPLPAGGERGRVGASIGCFVSDPLAVERHHLGRAARQYVVHQPTDISAPPQSPLGPHIVNLLPSPRRDGTWVAPPTIPRAGRPAPGWGAGWLAAQEARCNRFRPAPVMAGNRRPPKGTWPPRTRCLTPGSTPCGGRSVQRCPKSP
jgi:hypothetical protein